MIDEDFGARVRRHQKAMGLGDEDYGKAVADEMEKYGRSLQPVSRSALRRWRQGYQPSPIHTILLSDLMAIPVTSLGRFVGHNLSDDRIRRIIVKAGGDPNRKGRPGLVAASSNAPAALVDSLPHGIDWERIGATMRSMRRVDARVIADQWRLTRHYIDSLPRASARTLLDLMSDHITRLSHLRHLVRDDHLRRELDVMSCQTAVCAGILWTGLTDYGMAMEAYRFAVDLAGDLNDRGLRSTGLIMQAQLYGGHLEPRLALSPVKIAHLVAEAETAADAEVSPQASMFLHCHISSLHALLANETAAQRALERARQAQAQIQPGSDLYFAATTRDYCTVHEGALYLAFGRPTDSIQLVTGIIERTDETAYGTLAWFKWSLATACISARLPQQAAGAIKDALRLARRVDAPFLVRGAERAAETLMAGFDREPAVRELRDYLRDDGEVIA